jgi:hypothetical protein
MSKNIKDYKSEMQNVKFSPDFVSRTIAALSDVNVSETLTEKRIDRPVRINVLRNMSLAVAACFLCVFTVTVVMRQTDEVENIVPPEVVIPTVTAVLTETAPELIEEIGEFTPFAMLSSITDTEPLIEPEEPAQTAVTTVVKTAVTEATTEAATVVKTAVTEAATVAETAVTEAARVAQEVEGNAVNNGADSDEAIAESAEAVAGAGGGYSPYYGVSVPTSGDESLSEGDSADDSLVIDDSADGMAYDADTEEEAGAVTASSDEMVLTGEELIIANNAGYDSLMNSYYSSNTTGLLRYKDDTAVFLSQSQTTALAENVMVILKGNLEKDSVVFVNSADMEFHLNIYDNTNVRYVVYLFDKSLVIAVYDTDGNYTLSAAALKPADYETIFAEMYTSLFSETEYELYLARESGK